MSKFLDDPVALGTLASAFFTLLAAIGACLSAWASKRAARATEQATRAHLIAALLDAYAAPETLSAMMELRGWFSKHGKGAADEFRRLRQTDFPAIQHIDHSRRRVSHFFQKVCMLHKAGFLDESAVRLVASRGQVEFFREIIEPLEAAISADYDRSCFDELGALYGIGPTLPPMANP